MKIPLYPALRVDGIQKVAGNNCNGNKLNREDQLTLTANSLTSLTLGDEKESSYMDPELESQQTFQTFDEISIVESCSDLLDIDLDAPEFTVQLKNGVQKSLFREGHDVIYFPKSEAVESVGFEIGKKNWIGYWGKHWSGEKYKTLKPYQTISHFPSSFEIGRKDRLWQHFHQMRVKFGTQAFDYVPESYLWPQERRKLEPVFSKYPQWIIKPPASARGIGIRVITKFSSLPKTKEKICCKYINKPYLINSRKFDLRLYVLVSSFDPLRIYLFNDGVARFAAQDFKHGASKSSEKFMHLTNFSISKKFESTASESNPKFASGSKYSMDGNKWSLKIFEEYMAEQGIDYAPIREKIHSMIIKSIMSVQSHNVDGLGNMQNRSNAYELFGFDVLLDANLKPWLMEVNISPSLKASCQADLKVKQRLVIDMFNLIGLKTEDLDLAFKMQKKGFKWTKPRLQKESRQKQRDVHQQRMGVLEDLNEYDFSVLKILEDENERRGDFLRLWPNTKAADHFEYCMKGYNDKLIVEWTANEPNDSRRVTLLQYLLKMSATQNPISDTTSKLLFKGI